MMDVGLHHRRVHAHPPPGGHAFVPSYLHQPLVNLLENLRPERHAPAAHRLGIRRLAAAHAGEVPVHQIGAHLALQHLIAPVADVLEDQQPQHHLGRRAASPAATALGMSFRQSLVHRRNNGLIRQHRIGVLHPVFAKIAHLLGNQPVAEAELPPPHLNHAACSAPSMRPFRAQQIMIELANRLDRLLQLLIIAQPAAYLRNPLATHADLTRASSRIGHRQDKHLMPFAARAFRAILGVSDRALQQRAAQQLAA